MRQLCYAGFPQPGAARTVSWRRALLMPSFSLSRELDYEPLGMVNKARRRALNRANTKEKRLVIKA